MNSIQKYQSKILRYIVDHGVGKTYSKQAIKVEIKPKRGLFDFLSGGDRVLTQALEQLCRHGDLSENTLGHYVLAPSLQRAVAKGARPRVS